MRIISEDVKEAMRLFPDFHIISGAFTKIHGGCCPLTFVAMKVTARELPIREILPTLLNMGLTAGYIRHFWKGFDGFSDCYIASNEDCKTGYADGKQCREDLLGK